MRYSWIVSKLLVGYIRVVLDFIHAIPIRATAHLLSGHTGSGRRLAHWLPKMQAYDGPILVARNGVDVPGGCLKAKHGLIAGRCGVLNIRKMA